MAPDSSQITDVLVDDEHCRRAHITTRPHNRNVIYHAPTGTWYVFYGSGPREAPDEELIAWRVTRDGTTFTRHVPVVVGNGHTSSSDVLLVGNWIYLSGARMNYWRRTAAAGAGSPGESNLLRGGPDLRLHLKYYDGFAWYPQDVRVGLQDSALTCDEASAVADCSHGLGFLYWCQWFDAHVRAQHNEVGQVRFGLIRDVAALFR